MTEQHTLSIIKPDATKKNVIGKIITIFEEAGLRVEAAKMMHLTKHQAESFYEIHKERPFFADLVKFMTSGPVFIQVLAGDDAVAKNRKLMGATNPAQAEEGTIRKLFAESIDANAVHGSDSEENAKNEISFFFAKTEIICR